MSLGTIRPDNRGAEGIIDSSVTRADRNDRAISAGAEVMISGQIERDPMIGQQRPREAVARRDLTVREIEIARLCNEVTASVVVSRREHLPPGRPDHARSTILAKPHNRGSVDGFALANDDDVGLSLVALPAGADRFERHCEMPSIGKQQRALAEQNATKPARRSAVPGARAGGREAFLERAKAGAAHGGDRQVSKVDPVSPGFVKAFANYGMSVTDPLLDEVPHLLGYAFLGREQRA